MRKIALFSTPRPGNQAVKRIVRQTACLASMTLMALFAPVKTVAEAIPTTCGRSGEVTLLLDQTWQPVEIKHSQVLCIFRNKSGGFPSITVVLDSPANEQTIADSDLQASRIIDSYRSVGLNDAKLSGATISTRDGLPLFRSEVGYSTGGKRMTGIITVAHGASHTVIVTFLDTEEGYQSSRESLYEIEESLRFSALLGPRALSHPATLSPLWWGFIAVALITGLVATAALSMRTKR